MNFFHHKTFPKLNKTISPCSTTLGILASALAASMYNENNRHSMGYVVDITPPTFTSQEISVLPNLGRVDLETQDNWSTSFTDKSNPWSSALKMWMLATVLQRSPFFVWSPHKCLKPISQYLNGQIQSVLSGVYFPSWTSSW